MIHSQPFSYFHIHMNAFSVRNAKSYFFHSFTDSVDEKQNFFDFNRKVNKQQLQFFFHQHVF